MALAEWHITPEYINRHWTEELFAFMFMRRNDRIRKLKEQLGEAPGRRTVHRRIDNAEFFRRHPQIKYTEH